MQQTAATSRSIPQYIGLVLRGFAMGVCEIIPGVSGGTMAFILGIYEELIDSIKAVGERDIIEAALRFKIGRLFELLNWRFLVALVIGMLLAIVSLASLIAFLFENYPILLWSFFFGLVLASVFLVSRRIGSWRAPLVGLFAVAAVAAFVLIGLSPNETPNAWWFLLFSGAIAASALILPGVSGSYLLLLLKKYEYVLGSVESLVSGHNVMQSFTTLMWVGIGVIIGLVSFTKVVSWLFKRFHDGTIAVLCGLMLGSLRALWPWKEGAVDCIEEPELCTAVMPPVGPELFAAIGVALVGVAAIVVIEQLSARQEAI